MAYDLPYLARRKRGVVWGTTTLVRGEWGVEGGMCRKERVELVKGGWVVRRENVLY